MRRGRAVRAGAVLALVLAAMACSSDDGDGSATDEPAPTTEATGTSAEDEAREGDVSCDPDGECPLGVAGAEADLLVGTAGKIGDPAREELQQREFTAVTAENELLWSVVHPGPDEWDFTRADQVVDFAEANDMELTATHFVWDPPAIPEVLPDWVRAITDPDELRAVIRDHMTVLHDRYGGRIDRWNVVNEPLGVDGGLEPNHFATVLGPDYIAESFAMAEEIWPDALLVLNQDLVEYLPARADGLVELVDGLMADDVPVEALGLQGHLYLGEPDWALLEDTMDRLGEWGLPIDMTEIDVPLTPITRDDRFTEDQQAEWAARMVRTCLDRELCGSVTFWGFDDGDTWLDDFIEPGTDPLLFDADLQPKPMYDAVRDEILAGRPDG